MNLFSRLERPRRTLVATPRPKPIIVVSGLPRSGTSLMMQMLEAGGIRILTDAIRAADTDNPRGYYEFEPVKRLDRDVSWLESCADKAVKIVSVLLPALPAHHQYRILFMERKLPEILASQKTMLERRGMAEPSLDQEKLAASYERHIAAVRQALARRPEAKTLYISYNAILESPRPVAARIGRFLEKDLDLDSMVRSVDTALHRQKTASAHAPCG